MSGFNVDLDALRRAEHGVRDLVDELNEMTGGGAGVVGKGRDGRGLSEYLASGELSPEKVGHARLSGEVVGFIEAYDHRVKVLVEDGVTAADELGETRKTYENASSDAEIALKRVLFVAMGDPLADMRSWDRASAVEITEDFFNQDANGDGHEGMAGGR